MILAANGSYPLLDVFWSICVFALSVIVVYQLATAPRVDDRTV